jgi:hypothetical protein
MRLMQLQSRWHCGVQLSRLSQNQLDQGCPDGQGRARDRQCRVFQNARVLRRA